MKVLATYLTDEKELERNLNSIKFLIELNPENVKLETDDNECVGIATDAWIEYDHVVVEYDAQEKYKEELEKEGFKVLL